MSLFSNEIPQLGDGTLVNGQKIENVFYVCVPLTASSANQNLFVAPVGYKVVSATVVYGTASSSGTVNLEIIPSGTANGSGTTGVISAALSLHGTTNTPVSATLGNATAVVIPAGSRLGTVIAGTMTSLANGFLQVGVSRV